MNYFKTKARARGIHGFENSPAKTGSILRKRELSKSMERQLKCDINKVHWTERNAFFRQWIKSKSPTRDSLYDQNYARAACRSGGPELEQGQLVLGSNC